MPDFPEPLAAACHSVVLGNSLASCFLVRREGTGAWGLKGGTTQAAGWLLEAERHSVGWDGRGLHCRKR